MQNFKPPGDSLKLGRNASCYLLRVTHPHPHPCKDSRECLLLKVEKCSLCPSGLTAKYLTVFSFILLLL